MLLRKLALYSGLWFMKPVFERTCTSSVMQKQNFDITIHESSLLSFVQLDRH